MCKSKSNPHVASSCRNRVISHMCMHPTTHTVHHTGSYAATRGSSRCLPCRAGSYSALVSWGKCDTAQCVHNHCAVECVISHVGSFSNYSACMLACNMVLHVQSGAGSTTCLECGVGTYGPHAGSSVCLECSAGSYQNVTNQTACVDCSAGSVQDVSGERRDWMCGVCVCVFLCVGVCVALSLSLGHTVFV